MRQLRSSWWQLLPAARCLCEAAAGYTCQTAAWSTAFHSCCTATAAAATLSASAGRRGCMLGCWPQSACRPPACTGCWCG